jgi:hypothetical protein
MGTEYLDSLLKGERAVVVGPEGDEDVFARSMHDPNSFPVDELPEKLRDVEAGRLGISDPDEAALVFNQWLRWSQSGDTDVGMRWTSLTGKAGFDRDQHVSTLWRRVKENDVLRKWVSKMTLWEHYETHFFGWFLGRFNLSAARAVYVNHRLARNLHILWSLLAILLAGGALAKTRHFNPLFLELTLFVILVGICGFVRPKILPPYAYFHSLIPRLGAAIGIGYLFLLSAPHLVKLLDQSWRPPFHFWIASAVLVVTAFLYIGFHISRRVHPRLRWKALAWRSFSLLLLGVGYTALELLVMAPVLFAPSLLCGAPDCHVNAGADRLTLCAAIALNLGVILQLAWDEKPLTEPL